MKLAAAVAFGRAKNVAGQALRMDANKRRDIAAHLSFKEDNKFFLSREGAVSRNLEFAPFRG
jgi:hypothetical protein